MLLNSKLTTARNEWGGRARDFASFKNVLFKIMPSDKRAQCMNIIWEVGDSIVLKPRINWGRWVVDCPFCYGSELVWFEEPSLFMCFSCFNSEIGHRLLRVEIPNNALKIEEILCARPQSNRNWSNETMSQLKSENTKAGVV